MDKEIKGFSTYTADVASKEKISADKVTDLFGKCLLNETDFDEEGLTCDFRIGEGVIYKNNAFSVERLNEHRDELDNFIGQLSQIDHAPSYLTLCYDESGKRWTDEQDVVDMLVQLGTAAGMLFLTFPEQLWPYLPDGVPGVGKQVYDSKKTLYGIKGKEYQKTFK